MRPTHCIFLLISIIANGAQSTPANVPAADFHGAPKKINLNPAQIERIVEHRWNEGSNNCSNEEAPALEVFEVDRDTFILRQGLCHSYEAPFIYVLFGQHTVFIHDTGAVKKDEKAELLTTVKSLISKRAQHSLHQYKLLVTHSHNHSDHTAGDEQFRNQSNAHLVEPKKSAMREYFGFNDWPNEQATIDLGARELVVIPVPGHQAESIAVYDKQTQLLLTGDTFYPGRLYIKSWRHYKNSIQRLVDFSNQHPIAGLLGSHIEMSTEPGVDFPAGAHHHPNEASLVLTVSDLHRLNQTLHDIGKKGQRATLDRFIIWPLNPMQKVLSGALSIFR